MKVLAGSSFTSVEPIPDINGVFYKLSEILWLAESSFTLPNF